MMQPPNIAELFKRWRKPMREWVRQRAISIPSADLDDICQEAFVRLLRYPKELEYAETYIFRVVQNVANEWNERARYRRPHLKIHQRAAAVDGDDEVAAWMQLLDDSVGPEEAAERESECRCVAAAVNKLPHRAGVILLMHINDGKACKQIASELGPHVPHRAARSGECVFDAADEARLRGVAMGDFQNMVRALAQTRRLKRERRWWRRLWQWMPLPRNPND